MCVCVCACVCANMHIHTYIPSGGAGQRKQSLELCFRLCQATSRLGQHL